MLPTIGLIVAVYTLARLVQVPLEPCTFQGRVFLVGIVSLLAAAPRRPPGPLRGIIARGIRLGETARLGLGTQPGCTRTMFGSWRAIS
jgi:hypothetical protein